MPPTPRVAIKIKASVIGAIDFPLLKNAITSQQSKHMLPYMIVSSFGVKLLSVPGEAIALSGMQRDHAGGKPTGVYGRK